MHWLGSAAAKTGENRGQTTFIGALIAASAYVTDKRGLSPVFVR